MAGGAGRQLRLLLWKDYLIRKRKLITVGGVVWATLVLLTLYIVRVNVDNQDYPTCQFPARALPSAGMLNFLQSFICSINNECSPMDQYDEIPTFEKSRLSQLQKQFSPFLYNQSVLETAAAVPNALKLLGTVAKAMDEPTFLDITKNGLRVQDLFQNPKRVKRNILSTRLNLTNDEADKIMLAELSLQGVIKGNLDRCNATALSESIILDPEVLKVLVQKLCPLTTAELQNILIEILMEVDYSKFITMLGNMYSNLNGDRRLRELADTVRAVLRITKLGSFVPPELAFVVNSVMDGEFRYFNLTLLTRILDVFEPTFKDTEAYKSVRSLTETAVSSVQWLHRLFTGQNNTNPIDQVSSLVLQQLDSQVKVPGGRLSMQFTRVVDLFGQRVAAISVDDVFDVLPKITNFILKWLPKSTQHDVSFYGTLLAKLTESARRVVIQNMNIEQMVYNASVRNPAGVKVLMGLTPKILGKTFDALTDAERTQVMTAKLNSPRDMFCEDSRLQKFFQLPSDEVASLKKSLCTDEWINYVSDLIKSFGVFEVKKNINAMASLVVQETLGKDISSQLYSIEEDFRVLKIFVQELMEAGSKSRVQMDWRKLFNASESSELMKMLNDRKHLGKQVLITVHGALAKEIVKQNTVLDIKITPILVSVTTLVTALNKQLAATNKTVVADFKMTYPKVLEAVLKSLLDEDKTYKLLSTHNIEMFCNGVQNASKYIILPSDVDQDMLVTSLCRMTEVIEEGLTKNSIVGKTLQKLISSKPDQFTTVNWTVLINGLKSLYVTLQADFPYLFVFKSYSMDEHTRAVVDQTLEEVKSYWFGRNHVYRAVQLSINILFRSLDLIDREVFGVSNDIWYKLKHSLNSANGLLVICDEILKLVTALSSRDDEFSSGLPRTTAVALRKILPNVPQLVMDATDVIVGDEADVDQILRLLNSEPSWPCSEDSIGDLLKMGDSSKLAVRGIENILCMNSTMREEWMEYGEARRVRLITTKSNNNSTKFERHLFLRFSSSFNDLVKDANHLQRELNKVLNNITDTPSFIGAWEYAVDVLNRTNKNLVFGNFFAKVDTVLNAINTSTTPENHPLTTLWEDYIKCNNNTHIDEKCARLGRATWKHTLRFLSVMGRGVAMDLLEYFTEINEPNATFIQVMGFTRHTGLYVLYEKLADFFGVLLNSYWDYGFMNQIRRASMSHFWDCDGVVDALVIPPGSRVTKEDIEKVQPYVCPSLLYWVSLPRGENSILDVVAKPQYYFYTIHVSNLTSDYTGVFDKFTKLTHLVTELSNKNHTKMITKEDININTIENKVETLADYLLTWKLNVSEPSYILFNEIFKKQFISSIYLTRTVAIIYKIHTAMDKLDPKVIGKNLSQEDLKKLEADLMVVQKKIKRRPAEAIGLHFDIITETLWKNKENYTITKAIETFCDNLDKRKEYSILTGDKRFLTQICAKKYELIYGAIQDEISEDLELARQTLKNVVDLLQRSEDDVVNDIFEFFSERKEVTNALRQSITYADDLTTPIYLKYLQTNLHHYNIIMSFLTGGDWWAELRNLYNGTYANTFFDTLETSVDIVKDVVGHVDQIQLVRLLRDININNTESFCLSNMTLSEYIPDRTGRLSQLKSQMCDVEQVELFMELPLMVIVSQGFDNRLKLSKDVNYTSLNSDMNITETRVQRIRYGPLPPQRPSWISDEKLNGLREMATSLLSKEMMVKMSFGVLSNVVDASTLFLNNSQCQLCSQLTSWFKQLNLQLFKKQDYDTLLCHIQDMSLEEVYHTLKNDFHWDMALRELISTRNYTAYELNRAMGEFLEQIKLHLLDDVAAATTKLSECLARNVTRNTVGNATLFISVLSQTLKLFRSQLPHIQEVAGITDVPYLKQLHVDVSPNLHVTADLNQAFSLDAEFVSGIKEGSVDLLWLKNSPSTIDKWLILPQGVLDELSSNHNCTNVADVLYKSVNQQWLKKTLPELQTKQFWRFDFVSNILYHIETSLSHIARLLSVASRMDLGGVFEGKLEALLDAVLQVLQEDSLKDILYSLKGICEELHPVLKDSPLAFDMDAVTRGLEIVGEYRSYVVDNVNLKVEVSQLFSNPERIESGLNALGINDTNFWSLAAARIHAGLIDLTPLLSPREVEVHLSTYVCQLDNMALVILPSNLDVVTSQDVCAAVIDQFCALSDATAKKVAPILLANLNYSFVMDRVFKLVLTQVYAASNITNAEGDTVLAKYKDMLSLLPVVQDNVGNVTDMLAKEPLFEAFKGSSSLNGLLSSSQFLASAGNMVCGKPFVTNDNRFYRAIAESKDFNTEPDVAQLDVLPTDFCRSLYRDVLQMSGGKIIWSFVKPLLMGKILYTPATPVVNRIVERANSTFALFSTLADIVHNFASSFPSVQLLSEHRRGVDALRSLAASVLRDSPAGEGAGGLLDEFGDLQDIGGILTKASNLIRCVNLNRFHVMPDELKLTNEAVKLTRVNEFAAGLVFMRVEENDEKPSNVEYKIRMDIDSVPTTSRIRNQFWTPGPEASFLEDMRYFRGFIQIQDLIDSAIIELAGNTTRHKRDTAPARDDKYGVYTQQMPYPCYKRDYFQSSLYESQAVIVAFFFSLVFTASSAIRFIVAEKESGNTMLLSIMGVNLTNHTLSWFVASLVETAATCLCITAVLWCGAVLPRTDPTLLFALLMVFGVSVLSFCYMISKLFSSASLAAVCGALGYLLSFMPFVIILSLEASLSDQQKLITSLSMSTSFCYSMLHIARYEAIGVGAHWTDLWSSPTGDRVTIGVSAAMLLVDAVLYLAVGLLIDRFFGPKTLQSNITTITSSSEKAGVSIVNVSKTYRSAATPALQNVSVELHKGQVTTLLGHNGAGKTTLIKIITGMLAPSSGHVVHRTPAPSPRRTLGVCPQRDVLYESLSAREHLKMYAELGGLAKEDAEKAVEEIISVLSFSALSETPANCLSGGLRRRLCVALAFVARPALVLLDEPSSGVDPTHRRDIWTLIMKLKEDRTVLLTTHHLDEAELLSDQVVIMHKGQIHTIGSPIDIKRSLGHGYTLTVTFPPLLPAGGGGAPRGEERGERVATAVRGVVGNAQLTEVNDRETEMVLPFFDANGLNNDFLQVCTTLEEKQQELGFKTYAMDCSSLEQVLYNICTQADSLQPTVDYGTVSSSSSTETPTASTSSLKNDQSPLVSNDGVLRGTSWEQFQALLYKRAVHYSRNRWLLFLLLILPSLFVAVAMGFSMIRPPPDNEIALKLSPALYGNTTQFVVPEPTMFSKDLNTAYAESVMNILMHSSLARNWTEKDTPNCQCGEVKQQCDITDAYPGLPEMMALPNVTRLNEWLVSTQDVYMQKRYGGYTSALKSNRTNFVVWYNNKGHHAMPAHLSELNSALLQRASNSDAAGISTYTHPLKISNEQLSKSTVLQHVADAGISGMLLLAYSLIPAGAAIYLVLERTSQQKRLQLLSGVTPALYWAAAMLWDIMIILVNIGITSCVLTAFGFPVFVARDNLAAICLLLFLFGLSCNALVHVLEKLFTDPSMANMVLFCGNTFVGLSGVALLLIMDIISESDATDNARWTLHKIFLLSPQFALVDALVEVAKNTVQAQVLHRFGMDTYVSPLWGSIITYHYVALSLLFVLLTTLNLAIEYDYFDALVRRFRPPSRVDFTLTEAEDPGVIAERRRVHTDVNAARPVNLHTIGNINAGYITTEEKDKWTSLKHIPDTTSDVAQCVTLTHEYWTNGQSNAAVKALTLGVPTGQCTALLGENGAGKSTTFSMLTGELRATSGRLYLQGREVTPRELCTGLISYCPQSNAVDPLLTVRQTLDFYCQLRGITEQTEVIRRTMTVFELTKYVDVLTDSLSGGNKRKLCTAVAFMGRSPLVLLDEPTSGMDPGARACVCRAVSSARARALLVSTHALRDAARLAARVALMRGGRLCALAPTEDCLERFGGGALISLRVRRGSAHAAWRQLRARAPHARLRALHARTLLALLPEQSDADSKEPRTRLSDIFRLMAEMQVSCDVEDFTVNQSSLDEMFLSFTDKKDSPSLHLDAESIDLEPASPTLQCASEELSSVTAL